MLDVLDFVTKSYSEGCHRQTRSMRLLTTAVASKKYVIPGQEKKLSTRSGSTAIVMSHLVSLIRISYRKHRAAAFKRTVLTKWTEAEQSADQVEDSYAAIVTQLQANIDVEFEIVDKLCDDYEAVRDKGYYLLYLAVVNQLQDVQTQRANAQNAHQSDSAAALFRQADEDAVKRQRAIWHGICHRQKLHQITHDWTLANHKLQAVQRKANDLHSDSEDEMARLEDIRQECADQWNVLNTRETELEEKEYALIVQMAIFRKETMIAS